MLAELQEADAIGWGNALYDGMVAFWQDGEENMAEIPKLIEV